MQVCGRQGTLIPNVPYKQFTATADVPRDHFSRPEARVDINAASLRIAGSSQWASNYLYTYAAGKGFLIQTLEVVSFNVRVIQSINKEVRLQATSCEDLIQIRDRARLIDIFG